MFIEDVIDSFPTHSDGAEIEVEDADHTAQKEVVSLESRR